MTVETIEPIRSKQLINNLLVQIVNYTDIAKCSHEQYEAWLRTEVGFTEEELTELYEADLLPYPDAELER